MGHTGTTKLVTLSIGVVSTAVMLRFMGPTAYVSLSDWLPRAYVSVAGWLTPPYLYLIINGIILSIAASSRFSLAKSVPVKGSVPVPVPDQVPVAGPVSMPLPDAIPVQLPTPVPVLSQDPKPVFEIPDEEEEEFVIRGPRWDMQKREDDRAVPAAYAGLSVEPAVPVRTDSMEMASEYTKLTDSIEKQPVSARFNRKSVRPSPDGKALRVARSRKGETLESTWRTITEGRHMPLARHLKKSDTWETRAPRNSSEDLVPPPGPTMRKADTFHERVAGELPSVNSGEKVKREPSLGQDELTRRVEAFIKNFNEEMRMQRQESFKHYTDMINRGAAQ